MPDTPAPGSLEYDSLLVENAQLNDILNLRNMSLKKSLDESNRLKKEYNRLRLLAANVCALEEGDEDEFRIAIEQLAKFIEYGQ